jgi:hypothetical protein
MRAKKDTVGENRAAGKKKMFAELNREPQIFAELSGRNLFLQTDLIKGVHTNRGE